jgi:dienelactone hydrolase
MRIRLEEKMLNRRAKCTRCNAEFRFREALVAAQNTASKRETASSNPSVKPPSADTRLSAIEITPEEKSAVINKPAIKAPDSDTIPLQPDLPSDGWRAPAASPAPTRKPDRSPKPAAWFDELDTEGRKEAAAANKEKTPAAEPSYVDDSAIPHPPLIPPLKPSKRRKSEAGYWSRWAGGGGVLAVLVLLLRLAVNLSRGGSLTDWLHRGPENTTLAVAEWAASRPLYEARKTFRTNLIRKDSAGTPVPVPPSSLFRVVEYDSAVGKLAAFVSPNPGDGSRHPAIVWICGGDCNSIEDVWQEAPTDNDQTAAAFRKAGIVMMFPSLRGGNSNPGYIEGFFGEVEDVISAANYLAQQPYVDPDRIYLGGHSTGGTLALLVAESSNRFRAVFSFGPVASAASYGAAVVPINPGDYREIGMRSPGIWLHSIRVPVFVMEGQDQGNVSELLTMSKAAKNVHNSLVQFLLVRGATHFSLLAPATELISQKILRAAGRGAGVLVTEYELNKLFSEAGKGPVAAAAPDSDASAAGPAAVGTPATAAPTVGRLTRAPSIRTIAPPHVPNIPRGRQPAPQQPRQQQTAPRSGGGGI